MEEKELDGTWIDQWPDKPVKNKIHDRHTEIIKTKGDWIEVINDCRFTVGKEPIDKEPSTDFKKRILISEHSPIRDISFKWIWKSMPHWITVHWVRHKWEKFVRTQRTDRTGSDIPRNEHKQGEPQDFEGDANVQALIDTMRKRLCYQASKETREYAEDLKCAIHDIQPEIADVLVPNCIYRCGCPELCGKACSRYVNMLKADPNIGSHDIQERYDAFNKMFYKKFDNKTYTHMIKSFDQVKPYDIVRRIKLVGDIDHPNGYYKTSDGTVYEMDQLKDACEHEKQLFLNELDAKVQLANNACHDE